MLILKVFFVVGLLFLSSCASHSQRTDESRDKVKEISHVEKIPGVDESEQKALDTAIDADVLYLLLTAELAGQREQYDVALEGYLRAAKRVDDPRIAERAASIALYLKHENKVDEAVSLWITQDPESLRARKIAVLAAFRGKDEAAAIEHLNFLLDADPAGFETTLLEISKVMESEGKGAFVYDVLDQMIEQHPQQAVLPFVQAILAMQMGQTDVAQEKIQAALEIRPDWNKAMVFRAQLAAQSGDLKTAQEITREALEDDPENVGLQKLLASLLIKSGDKEGAAEVYKQLLLQQPDDVEVKYALALVYLQLKQEENARELLLSLSNHPKWQEQANLFLGRIAANKGDVDEALVWFDKITKGPLVLESGISAVSILIIEKRFAEASKRLQELAVKFPKQRTRFTLMEADILNEQKQYSQAFALLSKALEETPEDKELRYSRALVAERLDKLDVLEADLKQILEKYPNDANALNALGYTLVDRTDRLSEAEDYLRRAIKLQPDEAVIIDSFGWLQYKLGNYDQALAYLQRAYAGMKEGEIAAHLTEVLWMLGRENEAREFYQQALQEVTDKEPLLEIRQRLTGL